jgi:integrase
MFHLMKSYFIEVKQLFLTEPLNRRGGANRIYARASANKVLKRMKESLNYAEEIGVIDKSPWRTLRNLPLERKDKVHWRMPECRRFLEAVKERDHGHYTFFVLALNFGLRRGELYGLRLGDIDFDVGEIVVRRQWDEYWYGKCGKHRYRDLLKNGRPSKILPLTRSARDALKEHTALMVGDSTPLFPFGGRYMKSPKKLIELYADIAEVPVVTFHRMRDSFIANMSREGVNEAIIAAIAGCTKANLKHYQQFDSRDARRALKVLDFDLGAPSTEHKSSVAKTNVSDLCPLKTSL